MSNTASPSNLDWATEFKGIARYPFVGSAGSMMVALVLLDLLSMLPFLGGIAGLLGTVMGLKYGMETLREAAHGNVVAPEISANFGDWTLVQFLLLCAGLIAISIGALWIGGPLLTLAMLLGFAFVLPVAMMTLAIDEHIWQALNPLHWWRVIGVIGPAYLVAIVLVLVVIVAGGIVGGLASGLLGGVVGVFIAGVVRNAAWLCACQLLGRLVYRHRHALGFKVNGPEAPERLLRSRDDHLLAKVDDLAATGQHSAAIAALAADMQDRAVRGDVHRRYRELLQAAGDTPALVEHGRRWLHQLLVEKDSRSAVALANQCFELDPDFQALTHEDLLDIAQQAERLGMTALRLSCLRGLVLQGIGEDGWPDWLQAYVDAHLARLGNDGLREHLQRVRAACRKPDQRDVVDALVQRTS